MKEWRKMNVLQMVAELLSEAKLLSKKAKYAKSPKREWYYTLKTEKISDAIELDINGWHVDEYDDTDNMVGITYRGSWWFHVPLPLLSTKARILIKQKEVYHWIGREDREAHTESI
jgi:hypothetical protein